jgi:hypothetical protein
MMVQRFLPGYFFMIECYFLFFILFVFYFRSGEIPSVPAIALIFIGGITVLYFSLKREVVNAAIPFLAALIIAGASHFLGFKFMPVVMSAVFLYFRVNAFINDSYLWKEERPKLIILFYSTSLGVLLLAVIYQYPFIKVLFFMMIGFTILYSIGRYLQQLEDINKADGVKGIASILGIALLFTGIGTLIIAMAKWMLFKTLTLLTFLASLMGRPFFDFMEIIILKIKPHQSEVKGKLNMNTAPPSYGNAKPPIDVPVWFWVALAVIIVLFLFMIVRKKKNVVEQGLMDEQSDFLINHIPLSSGLRKKRGFFREQPPSEYLRRLFYQLHIYAHKNGMGRFQHETIREWFERVQLRSNEELFLAYESVRYGKRDIPREEAIHFEQVIQELKTEIKTRNKKK